ncbi:MAG: hypothetical protein ACAI44_25775, partial [Candidatus Sericytochromatia bacterium]
SYPPRNWTHVERTTFSDDKAVEAISDVAEAGCERINQILEFVLAQDLNSMAGIQATMAHLRSQCNLLAQDSKDPAVIHKCQQMLRNLLNTSYLAS